jgi:hypothetical protein
MMMGPIRNTEQQLDHIFYTLFCRCTPVLRLSPATATCAIMLSQNYFPESNRHILDFVHEILPCRITFWGPLEMLLVSPDIVVAWQFGHQFFYFILKKNSVTTWIYLIKQNKENLGCESCFQCIFVFLWHVRVIIICL